MHLLKAESPGPSVSKLVPRVKSTAKILYGIYTVMTFIMVLFLLAGKVNFYESLNIAFATAGTGGFAVKNTSIAKTIYINKYPLSTPSPKIPSSVNISI